MSAPMVAVFRLGYQDYTVPMHRVPALLELMADMRAIESTYTAADGYVYWPAKAEDQEHAIKMMRADRIRDAKPEETAPAKPSATPKPADERVITAPTAADPIAIKSVPPMREFVDEFRHEPEAA